MSLNTTGINASQSIVASMSAAVSLAGVASNNTLGVVSTSSSLPKDTQATATTVLTSSSSLSSIPVTTSISQEEISVVTFSTSMASSLATSPSESASGVTTTKVSSGTALSSASSSIPDVSLIMTSSVSSSSSLSTSNETVQPISAVSGPSSKSTVVTFVAVTHNSTAVTSRTRSSTATTSSSASTVLFDSDTTSSITVSSSATISKSTPSAIFFQDGDASTTSTSGSLSTRSKASSSASIADGYMSSLTATSSTASTSIIASAVESDTTYVSDGVTLTGSAAAAALAASATSDNADAGTSVSTGGGSKLSSFAIVGIVAGSLVVLVIIYLIWYHWRKKKLRSKSDTIAEDAEKDEDEKSENRGTFHSGFDFIDEPISAGTETARRRRSQVDPFDDGNPSEIGEDWYQEPQGGDGLEFVDGHAGGNWGMVDGLATTLGENLHTGYTTSYGLATARSVPKRQMSEPAVNPFAPPVPPVPSTYSRSRRASDLPYASASRPATGYSQAESVSYGDIYAGYASSRPGTFHDPVHEGPETMMTPATSTLLGWGRGEEAPPPVPALPQAMMPDGPGMRRLEERTVPPAQVERFREPVRAAMAQTPIPVARGSERMPSMTFLGGR